MDLSVPTHDKHSWNLADAGTRQTGGQIHSKSSSLCGRWNSANGGQIHSKSSSLELSWPVDVHRHVICLSAHIGVPMGITRTSGNLRMLEFTNHGWMHVHWNRLGL